MSKRAKAESLKLEELGDLHGYEDDELARLREKLIADVERIQAESAHHAKRISELNQARNDLQREQAERARSLRAVKHTLLQRAHTQKQAPRFERARSTARTMLDLCPECTVRATRGSPEARAPNGIAGRPFATRRAGAISRQQKASNKLMPTRREGKKASSKLLRSPFGGIKGLQHATAFTL